jgi:hypothetical protein
LANRLNLETVDHPAAVGIDRMHLPSVHWTITVHK